MERLIFAQFMIDSVLKEEDDDFELSEADLNELDNRVKRFRFGKTQGLTWEAVKHNMLSKRK